MDDHDDGEFSPEHVDIDRLAAYGDAGIWLRGSPGPVGSLLRLQLLEELAAAGVPLERLVAAARTNDLQGLRLDLVLEDGGLTLDQLVERAGVPAEWIQETYRQLGLQVHGGDGAVFEEAEADLLRAFVLAGGLLPGNLAREVLQAVAASLAGLTAAVVGAFTTVEEGFLQDGDELAWSEAISSAGELSLELAAGLRPLFRHHLRAAIRHQRASTRQVDQHRMSELSVGFVDLVGFTSRTLRMDPGELVEFVTGFRSRAIEVVGESGGRVVKHIGDEVMFSALDHSGGCEVGLALIEEFTDAGSRPRGGVAHGHLVARYGDLYGPVVNLASRLADIAVPGELLAPAGTGGDGRRIVLVPAGRRQLKGFDEPWEVVSVERPA